MSNRTGGPAPRGPATTPQESSGPDPGRLARLGDPDTILLVEDDEADVMLGRNRSRTAACTPR